MTPVLSLPSFTGNRNNIDILLYNCAPYYDLITFSRRFTTTQLRMRDSNN